MFPPVECIRVDCCCGVRDCLGFVLSSTFTPDLLFPQWEAFSLPELQNFLRILSKEEEDQFKLLEKRYMTYRAKLEAALRSTGKPD